MVHLFGARIPMRKRLPIALTQIYGIGRKRAQAICQKIGIGTDLSIMDLKKTQMRRILRLLKRNFLLGKDLEKVKKLYIQRLIRGGCYRGLRHRIGLPLRGQRTSTNGKTQRKLAAKHRLGR